MDATDRLFLFFALGSLVQAVALVRGSWNWRKFLGALAFGLMGPALESKLHLRPSQSNMLYCILFTGAIAVNFRKTLLPRVNEKILLAYTVVFWYAFFHFLYRPFWFYNCAVVVFLLPTLATIALSVTESQLDFRRKLFFYCWYLLMVVFMVAFQFSFSYLTVFFKGSVVSGTPLEAVLAGMAFCYMVVNITYIVHIFPIKDPEESHESCMKRWKHWTDLMTGRYDEKSQLTRAQALGIVLLLVGFLLANGKYNFMSAATAVNMGILVPLILMPGDVPEIPPQKPEPDEDYDVAL